MQQTARPRTVRTPSVHPHVREPTHGSNTPHQSLINVYWRRLKDSIRPATLLRLTLLPCRSPLLLKTEHSRPQDSIISTAHPSDSTDYSRPQNSIILTAPSINFYYPVKCDPRPRPEHRRPQENPDRDLKSKDRGPWTETQTRFRDKIVYSARNLFLSAIFCVLHKAFLSIV